MRVAACLVLLASLCCAQTPEAEQRFNDGLAATQRGDFAAAVRAYERVLQLQPDLVAARANLAAALVNLGRFDEAIASYRAALRKVPDHPGLRLNLALAYYKKGDFSAAAEELLPLAKQAPGDERIVTLLGDCDVHLKRYPEAIELLRPVVQAHPENLGAAYVLGSALIRNEDLRDGLALVERVAAAGNSADAWMLAAQTQLRIGEFQKASRSIDVALGLNPELPDAYTVRGLALTKTGDLDGAKAAFRKALQSKADDFEANLHLGALLYKDRDLDGAKAFFGAALRVDPKSLPARYEMALVKIALGQDASAVADLESILHESPDWLQPHVQLATLYYRLHRPEDGLRERQIVDRLMAAAQK